MNVKRHEQITMIAKLALVTSLYFALTVLIAPLSYGPIQIRFSEILLILCFFDKKYSISLIIGCFFANCFSGIPFDIIFGTLQTCVAVIFISYIRPLWLSLLLSIGSMVIIGIEIAAMTDLNSWWLISLQVMAGEAIALLVIAYPLSFILKKSSSFMNIVKLKKESEHNENEDL